MGNIYIAASEALPGMFKIGRTGRDPSERMAELSADDYGPSGFEGEADWYPHAVFDVENEVVAEAMLHEHFQEARLEAGRELFAFSDIEVLMEEAIQALGSEGMLMGVVEIASIGLDVSALATGVALVAVTYFGMTVFIEYAPNGNLKKNIEGLLKTGRQAFEDWGSEKKRPIIDIPARRLYRIGKFGLTASDLLEDKLLQNPTIRSAVKTRENTFRRSLSKSYEFFNDRVLTNAQLKRVLKSVRDAIDKTWSRLLNRGTRQIEKSRDAISESYEFLDDKVRTNAQLKGALESGRDAIDQTWSRLPANRQEQVEWAVAWVRQLGQDHKLFCYKNAPEELKQYLAAIKALRL